MPSETHGAAALKFWFERGLVEYRARRSDIENIIHPSNTMPVEDLKVALLELQGLMDRILRSTSHGVTCVRIASLFLYHEGDVDPVNPYYFRNHVPMVAVLKGDDRMFCDEFYAQLRAIVLK